MLLRRLLLRPRRCARALSSAAAATAAAAAPPSIAIVGSGPSGFYAAKYLLKDDPLLRVDVLDILPSPFGAPRRAPRARARVRSRALAASPRNAP
jgi:cation diffusion facilitator CzcD-associated flavoprotein CzcO